MNPALWLRFAARDLKSGLQGFWIFLCCLALGTAGIAMVGSLAAVLLPDRTPKVPTPIELHDRLEGHHAIQVPVVPWAGRPSGFIRIAAQAYNHLAQYEKLARALVAELGLA